LQALALPPATAITNPALTAALVAPTVKANSVEARE
jgi:hypothetical protein